MNKKCGKILLSGFSNAGKSTLINAFFNKKVSIVSNKVQTTNKKIRAILNFKTSQLIFFDTPGIVTDKKFFNKQLSRSLNDELETVDLNLFVLDSSKKLNDIYLEYIKNITLKCKKNFLILNKVDLIENERLLLMIKQVNEFIRFDETFPVSAKKNIGIDKVLENLVKSIPYKNWIYDNLALDNHEINLHLSEITREKVFELLNKEIPYSIEIKTSSENLTKKNKIEQIIFVAKKSQRAILIGKGGAKIKQIGTRARLDIEKLLKKKIFLDLKVSNRF